MNYIWIISKIALGLLILIWIILRFGVSPTGYRIKSSKKYLEYVREELETLFDDTFRKKRESTRKSENSVLFMREQLFDNTGRNDFLVGQLLTGKELDEMKQFLYRMEGELKHTSRYQGDYIDTMRNHLFYTSKQKKSFFETLLISTERKNYEELEDSFIHKKVSHEKFIETIKYVPLSEIKELKLLFENTMMKAESLERKFNNTLEMLTAFLSIIAVVAISSFTGVFDGLDMIWGLMIISYLLILVYINDKQIEAKKEIARFLFFYRYHLRDIDRLIHNMEEEKKRFF